MSISRTGKPQNDDTAWVSQVEWVKGDALKPETYKDAVSKCLGLVSCIGLISTSQEDMLEINGTANKAIIETAADAGVQRMAYISAHDYQFPGDLVVMKGYFDGKRIAEAALTAKFPQGGMLTLAVTRWLCGSDSWNLFITVQLEHGRPCNNTYVQHQHH